MTQGAQVLHPPFGIQGTSSGHIWRSLQMPCDHDDDAEKLIALLERIVLDLLREPSRDLNEARDRELVRQWLAERPASTLKRGGQQ
jgi:hypothetical protein